MQIYFEFFNADDMESEEEPFKVTKQILQKYKDYPVEHIANLFKQVQEYLDQVEGYKVEESQNDIIDASQSEQVTE